MELFLYHMQDAFVLLITPASIQTIETSGLHTIDFLPGYRQLKAIMQSIHFNKWKITIFIHTINENCDENKESIELLSSSLNNHRKTKIHALATSNARWTTSIRCFMRLERKKGHATSDLTRPEIFVKKPRKNSFKRTILSF